MIISNMAGFNRCNSCPLTYLILQWSQLAFPDQPHVCTNVSMNCKYAENWEAHVDREVLAKEVFVEGAVCIQSEKEQQRKCIQCTRHLKTHKK